MKILLAPDSGAAVAAPPAPATPAPAKPTAPAPAEGGDDFSSVDALAKAPKPKAAPVKPESPKDTKDAPKPKDEKSAPAEPAFDDPDDNKFQTPKALREARKRALNELNNTNQKLREYERKIADADGKGKDTSALAKRVEALEKEKEDLHASLRAAKQEVSPDFKQKYEAPLEKAIKRAHARIGELKILDEAGTPVANADWKVFSKIYGMEREVAKQEAKRLFGDDADLVMDYRAEIQRLTEDRNEALESEKENWKARQEKERADQALQAEQWETAQQEAIREVAERNAEWFQDGKDADENAIRKASMTVLENGVKGLDKDGNPLTPKKLAQFVATVRHRAANFPVMVRRLTDALERVSELEGVLAEKNGSAPGATAHPASGVDERKPETDWRDDLRKSVPTVNDGG